MVFATAIKRRLGAASADAIGLEWLIATDLDRVVWQRELAEAAEEALRFSGLDPGIDWHEHVRAASGRSRSARDAHRTMRNKAMLCALKGCGERLPNDPAAHPRFRYCCPDHAERDAQEREREG